MSGRCVNCKSFFIAGQARENGAHIQCPMTNTKPNLVVAHNVTTPSLSIAEDIAARKVARQKAEELQAIEERRQLEERRLAEKILKEEQAKRNEAIIQEKLKREMAKIEAVVANDPLHRQYEVY